MLPYQRYLESKARFNAPLPGFGGSRRRGSTFVFGSGLIGLFILFGYLGWVFLKYTMLMGVLCVVAPYRMADVSIAWTRLALWRHKNPQLTL